MPTNRRRSGRSRDGDLSPTQTAWLNAELFDKSKHDWPEYSLIAAPGPFVIGSDGIAVRDREADTPGCALWHEYGAAVTAEYVADNPGQRPERWWEFDAPEPRRRVGGVGTPSPIVLKAVVRDYYLGVEVSWITAADVRVYAKVGDPLGVPAVDLADPPMFESEATYLRRFKLFAPGEQRRVSTVDYEPIALTDILSFDEEAPE